MRRRLLNLAAVFSAALGVAVCVLWVASLQATHVLRWESARPGAGSEIVLWTRSASSGGGRLGVMVDRYVSVQRAGTEAGERVMSEWNGLTAHATDGVPARRENAGAVNLGIAAYAIERRTGGVTWMLFVPAWAAVLMCAGMPGFQLLAWRKGRTRRQRLSSGACLNCGYDLRASPGHCPECGAAPTAPAVAA